MQPIICSISCSWVDLQASKKQLPDGKVPLLVAVVTAINKSLPDATVTLKDLTGVLVPEYSDLLSEIVDVFIFSVKGKCVPDIPTLIMILEQFHNLLTNRLTAY